MRRGSRMAWAMATAMTAGLGCGGVNGYDSGPMSQGAACTVANATTVTNAIQITSSAFVPSCAKLAQNAAVTFTNADAISHTVTTDAAQPETFDSGLLGQNATFNHTFATLGTIAIHCNVHPAMHLTVFVQ